ncbi:MFS transporter [Marinoscillum furvescens]|uniref:Fucose permease n=1 Tax=Marinoscillum furvescens DSM 4134 TaxID=1122208 RepID=A0A3D9L265_MARFU|nr:MFS transporter [Marinoscillum furvescens]RED96602.1 fucose permease [Marinoscillum furvescens DSM 4134]
MEQRTKRRIALSAYFFLTGVGFSTWTSRIPTIKENLQINEAELGSILLVMPIASILGLPLSGVLVTKYETRWPMLLGFLAYALSLYTIAYAETVTMLVISVFLVAFFMRIVNISMNTQAITVQKLFTKKINGSFHALWSLGGITGVGITTLLIWLDVSMKAHLLFFTLVTLPVGFWAFTRLIRGDQSSSGNKFTIRKPDPYIMSLGLLILFAAICEGGMFDWSGIYFKEVIGTDIFTFGFLLFMICMTISRFISDWVIERLGMKGTFTCCALLIGLGIGIAVGFPSLYPAMAGFALVGFGTAPIIPMALLQAGESKKYSTGIAVSIIATYATSGMLIGPPIIGYLAHAMNLRMAFLFLLLMGLGMIPVSRLFFRIKSKT